MAADLPYAPYTQEEWQQLWNNFREMAVRLCVSMAGDLLTGELAADRACDKAREEVEAQLASGAARIDNHKAFRAYVRQCVVWRSRSAVRGKGRFAWVSLDDPHASRRARDVRDAAPNPEERLIGGPSFDEGDTAEEDNADLEPVDAMFVTSNLADLQARVNPRSRALLETLAALGQAAGRHDLNSAERSKFVCAQLGIGRNTFDQRIKRLRRMLGRYVTRRPSRNVMATRSRRAARPAFDPKPRLVRRAH